MIDQTSMDRIIGDYLEVNSDIVNKEFNSKLPKFMAKISSKNQRKKLLQSVNKFRNSGYILTWNNLVELFTYVFNNFEPEHSYGVISNIEYYNNTMEALVEFDGYHALIYFENIDPSLGDVKFNLKMKYGNFGIDIQLSRLLGSAKKTKEYVEELNYVLKNCIADYIEETIKRFMEA